VLCIPIGICENQPRRCFHQHRSPLLSPLPLHRMADSRFQSHLLRKYSSLFLRPANYSTPLYPPDRRPWFLFFWDFPPLQRFCFDFLFSFPPPNPLIGKVLSPPSLPDCRAGSWFGPLPPFLYWKVEWGRKGRSCCWSAPLRAWFAQGFFFHTDQLALFSFDIRFARVFLSVQSCPPPLLLLLCVSLEKLIPFSPPRLGD